MNVYNQYKMNRIEKNFIFFLFGDLFATNI